MWAGPNRNEARRATSVAQRLVTWYETHGRDFPWRAPTSAPYQQIVTEVLLQQTRAETVAQVYHDFFATYPSWAQLAESPRAVLEQSLRPLGIWRRRAQALQSLGAAMVQREGIFPSCRADCEQLPGVGQYVASAALLFQHGRPEPLLDGNMARVIERYFHPRTLADIRYDPWLQWIARRVISNGSYQATNWAMLDLAATICTHKIPRCEICPLRNGCAYRAQDLRKMRR